MAAFAASRLAGYASGLRYNEFPLRGDVWQLLDIHLLRTDLLSSVWHLQSQPPLLNLVAGIVLKLPTGLGNALTVVLWLACGLVTVLCAYRLLVELSVPDVAALVVVLLFVVASPAYLLYENLFSDTYPTAALLTAASYFLLRFLRRGRLLDGCLTFAGFASVLLLNSHYQLVWVLVLSVVVLAALRWRWRTVLVAASVPMLAVGLLYAKNAVMFGTTTTSSWLGMNLARGTLDKAPRAELRRLVAEGQLTRLALVHSFSPVRSYEPLVGRPPRTGAPALDRAIKSTGYTNFNDLIYVKVSSQFLRDDLAYIRHDPGAYARTVLVASELWVTPADQAFAGGSRQWRALNPYARAYDRIVLVQPRFDGLGAVIALVSYQTIPGSEVSYVMVATTLLALFGLPLLAWRRRRCDRPVAGWLLASWWTVAYGVVVTSLLDLGENNRFSFELGPLPLVAATVVVTASVRALWARRARLERRGTDVPAD